MAGAVFVDSGPWIALSVRRDSLHEAATTHLRRLVQAGRPLVTSNLVVAESYALIRYRGGHGPASTFLRSLRSSQRVRRIVSDPDAELAAEQLLQRFDDQEFSYVDAVSFTLMRRNGIQTAFAFDQHFRTMGYVLAPGDL
jgi:uncharacterized protein